MTKIRYCWNKFQFFRKRFFILRLTILLIILVYFSFGSGVLTSLLIVRLTNMAIDAIFMAGVPTVCFARGYRAVELSKIEKKILADFGENKNGFIKLSERKRFSRMTGFSLFQRGRRFHIQATGNAIVDLAGKMGYEKRDYRQISLECFKRAKNEGDEMYGQAMTEMQKWKKNLSDYRHWDTWKWGTNGLYYTMMSPFNLAYWQSWRQYWSWREMFFSRYSTLFSGFRDWTRGVIIKKMKGEPGYYVQ